MNIRRRTGGIIGIVAVASVAALTVTGCARGGEAGPGEASASPGITDTTITLGVITPLSGPTAGPGNCTVDGLTAYFGAANADGGIEFADGKTRTVEIEAMDDTYDPQKSLSNYQSLKDSVFAITSGLGTPTNRAFREAAIEDEVPQVLIMTGDPIFSDEDESPWQLGFVPVYQTEGFAFGELLAASGGDHKVAILSQNDDFGAGYVEGFKEAISGSDNIEVVGELTYEASDTNIDAQITELAGTDADVFVSANSQTNLVGQSLLKAQEIGWLPNWFLPSNTSSPAILGPGNAVTYPGVYTTVFSKSAASPATAEDEDMVKFFADMSEYAGIDEVPSFPHCVWSYMVGATLDQVFQKMTEPTRANFMEQLRTISGFDAPLGLDGIPIDTAKDGQAAVSTVQVVKYNGAGYAPAESFE
ncbi:ABC transporter substrate-binding protein [Homoserinimonas sp. A447]